MQKSFSHDFDEDAVDDPIEKGNEIRKTHLYALALLLPALLLIFHGKDNFANAGQWTQKSSGATVRADHEGVVYNNRMYIFAGRKPNGPCLNDLWEYNFDTDKWIQKSSGATQRDCLSSIVYGAKIYIFGGNTCGSSINNNDVWAYDILTNTWSQKKSGATARNHPTAALYNGKMYIYGGHSNSDQKLKDLWEYDIGADAWTRKSDGPLALKNHSAVVYSGKMYIFGGTADDFISDKLYEYNFSNDSWNLLSEAPFRRLEHSAVVINDKLYIFGGAYPVGEDFTITNELWEYDFSNKQWTRIGGAGFPDNRWGHSAVVYNNQMYVFGGCIDPSDDIYLNDLWQYDFAMSPRKAMPWLLLLD
jgi:N-acetylneuraminic acid mutarotase